MRKLKMTIGGIEITAELFDTPTADAIYQNLPFSSTARTWGEEVYFDTPVTSENEAGAPGAQLAAFLDARDVVEVGELAFWLAGNAIAIGFGPTPVSQGEEIRLASPCNVWGRAVEDVRGLMVVKDGDPITVERLS